ncbi:hypothetical protein [Nonomuraea sp. NPDC050643]
MRVLLLVAALFLALLPAPSAASPVAGSSRSTSSPIPAARPWST